MADANVLSRNLDEVMDLVNRGFVGEAAQCFNELCERHANMSRDSLLAMFRSGVQRRFGEVLVSKMSAQLAAGFALQRQAS